MKQIEKITAAALTGALLIGGSVLTAAAAGTGSFRLYNNGTVITVNVPLGGDADWYVDPDTTCLDLLTSEIVNGEWVGSFRALPSASGDDRLEVRCFADGLLYGYYTVDSTVSADGTITVTQSYGQMDDYDADNSDTMEEFGLADFESYTAYVTAKIGLNLRNCPATGSITSAMPYGSEVIVMGEDDGWCLICWGDRVGYCSQAYLSKEKPSGASGSAQIPTAPKTNAAAPADTYTKKGANDYLLPYSSTAALNASDLAGLSGNDIQMAINEIYARHGRRFSLKAVQDYFNQKTWYKGTVDPADFSQSVLNQYENSNIALMKNYMTANGLTWGF